MHELCESFFKSELAVKSELLFEGKSLKAGRIVLLPGEDVGEHTTEKKEEILIVLRGTATLLKGKNSVTLKEHETRFMSCFCINHIPKYMIS